MGLTDRMTFLQRLQNVLGHCYYNILHFQLGVANFVEYDKLKDKYNIKPEISTLESHKQALLYFMHGSFGLEFPRPLQPNIKYVLYHAGLNSNQMMDEAVAKFLDTAPDGVVLFSLGSVVRMMGQEQGQLFADAFASLPHRVLWQSNTNLTGLQLGNNTMVARWLPMINVMEHVSVRAFVFHGAYCSMNEALWAGVPLVGIPLYEDMMDNMVRVEARGAGLSLDISGLTSETLSQAIHRVITEPEFSKNAQRVSKIMRDLQNTERPADNVARWILHVTRFGGDHLRPTVMDLTYVQRNLLDVYLFIGLVLASIIMINVFVCYFCCRSLCRIGRGEHFKKE
ncbi:UDP-glucuronosyltransferase 2B20-like [Acanthaster planci]|uniref:UDP-glucuronosyltransferase 2B20-like n=1 Tax=Acanthaster planci TaxID=133434 RepID=A0A8B7Z995_ACAPL|nr:UDP-glucuronosyltransferase 2B20-like [Acanthaster planci]